MNCFVDFETKPHQVNEIVSKDARHFFQKALKKLNILAPVASQVRTSIRSNVALVAGFKGCGQSGDGHMSG